MRFAPFAVVAASLVLSVSAHAGRRTLAFTPDAVQLAPGVLELEEWVWARAIVDGKLTNSDGWLYLAPIFGVTENLEIAMPLQVNANQTATTLASWSIEGRYAFFDPVDETLSFRPQLRLGYQQNFSHPDNGMYYGAPWITADFVGTIGQPSGQHVSFDIGLASDFKSVDKYVQHTLGLGVMTPLLERLLVGAEYRHEITLTTGPVLDRRWFFLGPSASYARGRLWASMSVLVGAGTHAPRMLPRVALGFVL